MTADVEIPELCDDEACQECRIWPRTGSQTYPDLCVQCGTTAHAEREL